MPAVQTPPSFSTIGRISGKSIKYGSSTILGTTVSYVSGANGSKTALISKYQNGNDLPYRYDYDANGNINHIWRGDNYSSATVKFAYVYDNANQLNMLKLIKGILESY